MKNIDFLLDNIGIILTTLVSILSIVAVYHQARVQMRRNTAEKFIEMKFSVYSDYVDALSAFTISPTQANLQNLIAANYKAMMLSHPVHAETFSHFCAVCTDFVNEDRNTRKDLSRIEAEFNEARTMMQFSLQCEMQDIDPSKHKIAKRILRKRRIKNLLTALHVSSEKQNH